jgi:hypothetical protein
MPANSSAQAISLELAAAGVKAPGTFNDVRFGPFMFSCLLTDNATTAVNLRAAATIADIQLDTLGGTADNPPVYLVVNGYKLSFPSETETPDIQRQIKASPYLHHEPTKGPQRQIMMAPGIGTVASGGSATTTASATTIATNYSPAGMVKLKNPLIVAMRRELFEVRFLAAVNTAGGNITGLLQLYGYVMPDDVPLSPVSVDCVSESDAKAIGSRGIAGVNLL